MEILVNDYLYSRYDRIEQLLNGIDEENASADSCDDILLDIFDKNSIMILLKCESDKALRFLKLMYQMKYAVKIGNQYYIRRNDFDRFFDDFMGKSIAI